MSQLKLDFSKKPFLNLDNGKKLERVSFSCSDEFKQFLDLMVSSIGIDRSNLIYRYVLEGMQRDLAQIFLNQPHLDESLREILRKGF